MSAISLGNLAADRDQKPSGEEVRSATETLVAIIPTEVLAAYTALVAISVTTVEPGEYAPFRWTAYAGFVVAAAIAPISSFRTKMEDSRGGRSVPWAECLAAGAAAAAWGLVMPGTPLDLLLHGRALTLGSAAIILGGGTLLTIASTFLKRANKSDTTEKASGVQLSLAAGDDDPPDRLGYRKLADR